MTICVLAEYGYIPYLELGDSSGPSQGHTSIIVHSGKGYVGDSSY